MKYLILTADYNHFLRDEFNTEFHYSDLNLPIELIEMLIKWHEDYLPIAQLSSRDRMSSTNEILKLDEWGIELAKNIRTQLGEEDTKIKYFSEGLLKYIMF